MTDLNNILTEQRNPLTKSIDTLPTLEMVRLINREDHQVAPAVEKVCPEIARAVDVITDRVRHGGRLIYMGCGTSGRLGILDAVECPPTFSVNPSLVQGLIAGGTQAIFRAVEGAEDNESLGESDLKALPLTPADTLVGIAASGRTPYVLGGMRYAKSIGAAVIAVTCCPGSAIDRAADIGIAPVPGPEVITGSTRMKSGTAQKMVLNMLSTCTMIRLGKVYGNLMVDVKASNQKLVSRCVRIVREAASVSEEVAVHALEQCGYRCKTAIVMLLCGVRAVEADALLNRNDGLISKAVEKV